MIEKKRPQDYFSEIEVEDGEGFHSQKSLSKEQIILKALQKCMDEGSKEMTEGGLLKRIIDGKEITVVVPNQKEIYINSVKMFWSLVFPLILDKYQKYCKESIGDFTKRMEDLDTSYNDTEGDIYTEYKSKQNSKLFHSRIENLKFIYEQKKMDLYREKMDFGIMVIEKENWFGERVA